MKQTPRRVFKIRWIVLLILTGAAVFSLPLMRVWQHVFTTKLAKENRLLQRKMDILEAGNAVIQVETDKMISNDTLENIARQKFKMEYAKPGQVVFVKIKSGQKRNTRDNWHEYIKKKKQS